MTLPPCTRCGKPKARIAVACRACLRAETRLEKEARLRADGKLCQAARCTFAAREGKRMCGVHLPRFEHLTPPLEHYATARRGWE